MPGTNSGREGHFSLSHFLFNDSKVALELTPGRSHGGKIDLEIGSTWHVYHFSIHNAWDNARQEAKFALSHVHLTDEGVFFCLCTMTTTSCMSLTVPISIHAKPHHAAQRAVYAAEHTVIPASSTARVLTVTTSSKAVISRPPFTPILSARTFPGSSQSTTPPPWLRSVGVIVLAPSMKLTYLWPARCRRSSGFA